MTPSQQDKRPASFILGVLAVNVALLVVFVAVYVDSRSQLILAQGADSLFDLASGVVLTITAAVGLQPHDEKHPFGHSRAEPIGALITAVLAGVLAFEVLRSAIWDLVAGEPRLLSGTVALVLGIKCLIKTGTVAWVLLRFKGERSSALRALFVDARNDMIATLSSLAGWLMAREGIGWADAAMAIPVAVYIGYAGFALARENLRYLMGEAPDEELHSQLVSIAASRPGVLGVKRVRAQYLGQRLHVETTILVCDQHSATQAHDIALDVRHSVEEHDEVEEVFVHVDTRAALDHA
jgi:cation diffusion facilitator family transporter